ncbi:MAG: NBR1-Ig-like domain-containing protein [Polyangiales bacterium]
MALLLACVLTLASMATVLTSTAAAQIRVPAGGHAHPRQRPRRVDSAVYATTACDSSVEAPPAFANSQVYGNGGSLGPGGANCDAENFQYPWWDNYCEKRNTSSWSTPLCPDQNGGQHYGQDIRAASCEKEKHWVVAVEDGTITSIGSYSVNLTTAQGKRYQYLHMGALAVSEGQAVTRGQRIGMVSNVFGGTWTTTHLHFAVSANVDGIGMTYVPPYTSLVDSYKALLGDVAWAAELVSQTNSTINVSAGLGGEATTTFVLRNTGKQPWTPGKTFLGTTGPRDRTSSLATAAWSSPGRAVTVPHTVAPGEQVALTVPLRVPTDAGMYRETFGLVEESVAWFGDQGGPSDEALAVTVTIDSGVPYRALYIGHGFAADDDGVLRVGASSTTRGWIEVRNTGTETWLMGATSLATTSPRDRASAFAASSWPSPTRPSVTSEAVTPGATARFEFDLRAPSEQGTYVEYLGLVDTTAGWFGDAGGPADDAIALTVEVGDGHPRNRPGAGGGCSSAPPGHNAPPVALAVAILAMAAARRRHARTQRVRVSGPLGGASRSSR